MYFIILSGIISSIYINITHDTTSIYADRKFHLAWYTLLNLPIIYKRTITELNFIGKSHFIAANLFVVTLVLKLLIFGSENN